MSDNKRDLSNLLWSDLVTDEERLRFIASGRAVQTGIIAQAIVDQVCKAFQALCTEKQIVPVNSEGGEG